MEFKNRRCAGEAITAKQFVAERLVPNDPEVIIDLAFAEFLDSEKGGELEVSNRLCEQFAEHAKELRRQILFHRALNGSPNATVCDEETNEAVYPLTIPGLELIKPLGRGGMGIVYLAHQPKLNRKVAVKLLLDGIFASALHRARFRAEAQAAAALRHPNIVQIDEVGEANGQPYLVMEYVDGGTLEEFIKKQNPSPQNAAKFVSTLAIAIKEAHLQGIIHRDLKPGNILLAPAFHQAKKSRSFEAGQSLLSDWLPKITDFGLAKWVGSEQNSVSNSTLTLAGDLLGTPSYMAPEQASGGVIGTWTDVYSLGAILYQLLSGRPPFLAATAWETLTQVQQDEPNALPKTVPIDLRTICLTCLSKQPLSRYATMDLLSADLESFLENRPIAARRSTLWARSMSWYRRNESVTVLAGIVFMALLTILGLTLRSRIELSLLLEETELSRRGEAASHARSIEHHWDSLIAEAQAHQSTGKVGQHVSSLASVSQAQKLIDLVGETPERIAVLRDTASACLPLSDIVKVANWKGPPIANVARVSADRWLSRVAVISDNRIMVTEAYGEKEIFESSSLDADHVALSPDGMWLAAWGAECHIYDLSQRIPKIVATYSSSGYWGFSDSGKWLVGLTDGELIVVDLSTQSIRHRIEAKSSSVPLAFSLDNRKVAFISEETLVVLDIESGEKVAELEAPAFLPDDHCLAWHPNHKFLAAGKYANDRIAVWNVETGEKVRSLYQPGGAISVAFDSVGQNLIASSTWAGEVNIFDLESEDPLLGTFVTSVGLLASSPELGIRLIVYSVADKLEVFEIRSQKIVRPYLSTTGPKSIRYIAVQSPNGRLWAVSTDQGIEIYDHQLKSLVAEIPIGPMLFNRIAFDSSERLWACKNEGWLSWNTNPSGISPPDEILPSEGFFPVQVNHEGTWSLESDSAQIKLRSLVSPHKEIPLGPNKDVRNASFSYDGRMVATGEWNGTGGVKVWDTSTGKRIAELNVGRLCEVQFSPDGRFLITSPNGGEVWETTGWTRYHRLDSTKSSGTGFAFAFSPDSNWIANSTSSGLVMLWDIQNRQSIGLLRDPKQQPAMMLVFSNDKGELHCINRIPLTVFKSWNLQQLRVELKSMGIDFTNQTGQPVYTTKPLLQELVSATPLHVGRNETLDKLVAGQWFREAKLAIVEGNWPQGLRKLEEARQISPRDPEILNSLAWNLLVAPMEHRDPEKALDYAGEAVRRDDSRNHYNTLGAAQYRCGRFQEAIASLTRSLGDGTDQTAAFDFFLLATCRARLGQVEAASISLAMGVASQELNSSEFSSSDRTELKLFRLEAENLLKELALPQSLPPKTPR